MEYSCGTAAIRGTKELGEGQHFWEIKMTSPVYGTDMVSGWQSMVGGQIMLSALALGPLCPACYPQMVGIGTSDVDLDKYHHTFCSLLGRDEDSWGLSYTGAWGPEGRQARREHQATGLTPTLLSARAPPSQGRQDKLLFTVWPRLHHWCAPGHLAWDTDLL